MEHVLRKIYRRLIPTWIKRRLPSQTRDRLLEILGYMSSRPTTAALRQRRRALRAERRGDWPAAAEHWRKVAMLSVPPVPEGAEEPAAPSAEEARKLRHALNGLRRARAHMALALRHDQPRAFRELACRVVESLPDQRLLKNDPLILAVADAYVRDALAADGVPPPTAPRPGPPRRIAICLDVLKISEVHTHSRVIFSICRNLMALDPAIETHLVVTRERFAVTTPIVTRAFSPARAAAIRAMAQEAMGDLLDRRFFLHLFHDNGLEGVVGTCKAIVDLAPDVILYGGGHKGLYSNESRLVRHALYDRFASVFFHIQSNNEVDPRLDMIIARGPHDILGDPGAAAVRVQPYPTILETPEPAPVIAPEKAAWRVIVSAISGVRMNQRMRAQDRGALNALLSVLDEVPGTVWHFIGAADPQELLEDVPLIAQRVRRGQVKVHPVLPFDTFSGIVAGAALFVHPPGFTGGSGGAAVARANGVPILTCRNSDVSGRQPPRTVFDDGDARGLARMAARLLTDPAEWRAVVEAQIAHTAWIRDTSAEGFHACLAEAVELARERIGPDQNPTRAAYRASG